MPGRGTGGPAAPHGPQRRQGPPPDRVPPQRYRADGPPVASGRRRPPESNQAVPLLTHDDDGDTTAIVSDHGAPTAVAERPRRPAPTGRGRKKVSPWRRVRRISYVVLGLLLIGPFVAFVVGWFMFPVPSSQDVALAQVATFKFADGETDLATVRPENENRIAVTLDKVPKHVRDAVLSAEDRSFYSNPGFDFMGIGRAVYNQLTNRAGGGSTITQQYIKVSTGEDDVSLWRKYKEVVLAVKISKDKTKDEILENYLNTIYWGRGASGIQAAAKAYFNKDVGQLTVSEGAMLAGVIQSPSRWDPAKNREKSEERWNFVLDGMVEQGWLDRGERAAQTFPDLPQIPEQTGGGVPGDDRYHIYERAVDELAKYGITQDVIATRGVTITTTVQQPLQAEAVDVMKKQTARQPDNLRTGLVSIDPKTGAILSYYGGTNGLGTDYAMAFRQPGSSFKPFVLAAALQGNDGFGLGTELVGTGPREFPGRAGVVRNVEGVSCDLCGATYAMTESINTWFYELGIEVGPDNVAKAAHQAGIPDDLLPNPSGGIALGDKEVHPVDMASAYATFAAEGVYHEPYIVSRVEAADGEVLYEHADTAGQQVMPQQVARNVIEAMLGVAPKKGFDLPGREVAAKTGTAQLEGSATDNRDAWFVGFTPGKSTAVWVGSDKSDPIRNAQKRPIFGSGLPGQIWHEFMKTATEDDPPEQFSQFVPIGTPPVDESLSTETPDDDCDDDDSDCDEDSDSTRSSDDDNGSSQDNNGSSGDNNNSRSNNFDDDSSSNSGSGSSDQPTSADTQDTGTSGTSGSSNRGQSDRSALNRTSDSGPAG